MPAKKLTFQEAKSQTIILLLMLLMTSAAGICQENFHLNSGSGQLYRRENLGEQRDSNKIVGSKNKVQKMKFGGVFFSPNLGVSFPLGTFNNYSNAGFVWGVKFEVAHSSLYPFVFGFVYENQKNYGSGDFTTSNQLSEFYTKIKYIGGSCDIILNKFLKSDFTTTIFGAEIKYANVVTEMFPNKELPGIKDQTSLIAYSASLSFTLYVFDVSAKYTYASQYSGLNFQTRLHIPIFKF